MKRIITPRELKLFEEVVHSDLEKVLIQYLREYVNKQEEK